MRYFLIIFLVFQLSAPFNGFAQQKERIKYRADLLEFFKIEGEAVRKLVDNVVFTQEGTTVYCDSSLFFPALNKMEAFGNVKIIDDSVTITADRLVYEGNARKSRLRDNVIYRSGTRTLYTDFLDYELDTKIGQFYESGRLVDETNTLTSQTGIFFSRQSLAIFRENVVLVSPEYTLKSDTLRYNTQTKVAVTPGPTQIITPDGVRVDALGGEYLTERKITEFVDGEVETQDYILEGDELYLDDLSQIYTAEGNVKMTAKTRDVIIIGDEGLHYKQLGMSKIYGRPVMKKLMQQDTFYLTADTLYAIESEIESEKRILAYHNVKMFRVNLQGKADSIAYFLADSMIHLYDDPILWTESSQITADSINILVANNVIDKMFLNRNSFISSLDSLKNYNQIKGRKMVAQFANNSVSKINVNGNGESIYYLLDEGDSIMMGLNKMICSDMLINFNQNEIKDITFYKQPEARLIPPHEIKTEDTRLDGFSWRIEERPLLYDVAYYYKPASILEKKEIDGSKIKKKKEAKPDSDTKAEGGGTQGN